jgi:dTMP kinase
MTQLSFARVLHSGKLIVFCGLDGSGKTTQIQLLEKKLSSYGLSSVLTRQPTDFVRKSKIFRTFHDQADHDAYDYRALSLIAAGDRIQHSNREILPVLLDGQIVISDRYFYSCLANLRARGYAYDRWIYEIAQFIPKPDVVFFMDIDVDMALMRVRSREDERDKYVDKELQYLLRVEYLQIAQDNNGIVLSAYEPPEVLAEKVFQHAFPEFAS